jgi:hypothetical protein
MDRVRLYRDGSLPLCPVLSLLVPGLGQWGQWRFLAACFWVVLGMSLGYSGHGLWVHMLAAAEAWYWREQHSVTIGV